MRRLLFFTRLSCRVVLWFAVGLLLGLYLFLACLGVLTVSDAVQPPNLPSVRPLPAADSWRAHGGGNHTLSELLTMNDRQRWDTMQPALSLLHIVCPTVEDWSRQHFYSGRLVFVTEPARYMAYYVPGLDMVAVNVATLQESDAEIAITLAHEFRHSRQNALPVAQAKIAGWFGLDRWHELVEEDAYEFEYRIARAIRGK